MEYELFFTCAATVAMTKCMKRDYKKIAERLDETYSQNYLDKNLKKDFIKAGDDLYKRIKQVKYKNDKERALVLQNYSNSISEPGSKKFFGKNCF